MREFWIIFKQAFMSKAKSKTFLITTAVAVAGIFLLANITTIIEAFDDGEKEGTAIPVVADNEAIVDRLGRQLAAMGEETEFEVTGDSRAALEDQLKEGEIESFLILQAPDGNAIQAEYVSESTELFGFPMMLQEALQSIQTEMRADEMELAPEQAAALFEPVVFEQTAVSSSGKTEEEMNQARILVYVLMFLIYFAVIMYSNMIATEVATEKSSRVMEILISSVSPVKHMFAKVLGIGTLGLGQMLLFGISGYLAVKSSSAVSDLSEGFFSEMGLGNIPASTIIYAILFFVLGYFLYAVLAALLGSLVSRTEDVASLITPLTLIIVVAFIIAATGLSNPDAAFVTYSSYVPFFAPLVMFLRVGLLDLPWWEPAFAIGLMVLTIGVLGWFGARVYKGGVLMYGPSRSLKDLKKAMQLGKE
ncbi:ABC transporter permease [Bhargavaea beijingensis]|uniref:ABC transporter permease n=1 Tax=Bhargavaea beijingensis TaxID=426756 RepID=A0A1G7E1D9_9BACL|nr:ABC transporter permease [Bhargavaea beijingensis]RSK25063.1 ABC transporter permease [Bhargavaea beijingensis]SDE57296.1 ABC-2 type transport system permease protein [Bhargavaea beijingensis]